MILIFKIYLVFITAQIINAKLTVSKVVVRVPHRNDIGLIIDLSVANTIENNQRELLEFSVRSESACRIKLCPSVVLENVGHLMGGFFGCLAAGATETVSLIWPTLSLFNRVGSCSIVITSKNPKKEQTHLKHVVSFDTRFTTLDPDSTGLRKDKNFKDCLNFDLDYLNKCQPVNCEERYFGRRNFFNCTKKRCEEVPRCFGRKMYDPFANECVDSQYTVTKEDIKNIKTGNFKEYDEWLKLVSEESSQNYENSQPSSKNKKRGSYDDNENEIENKFDNIDDIPIEDFGSSYVLKGVVNGMMLVFATIGIYILICFVIFLVVSFISKRQSGRNSMTFSETPSVSSKIIKLQRARSPSILKRPK